MTRLWVFGLMCSIGLFWAGVTYAQAGAAPAPAAGAPVIELATPPPPQATQPIFGVEVDPDFVRLPADLRAESAGMTGVRVRRIVPNTMAQQVGLQPGDVIYKINNKKIQNFDDVMEILVEMRPNVKGRVDFVRGNATFIRDFRVDETYNRDFNFLYLVWTRESRFAGRFDFCGIICNTKELNTKVCGSFAFLGPLIFDFHKVGPAEVVTTLFLLKFRKGTPAPVVF